MLKLDQKGICASAGSACNSSENTVSHVLTAIGLDENDARSALRVTFGEDNTIEEKETVTNDFGLLEQYGENFSTKVYLTNPAIGRDKEIGELIVTLLTPEKSGILVGKPGIGKTAIVEGLGYRIQRGEVPDALKGFSIFCDVILIQ